MSFPRWLGALARPVPAASLTLQGMLLVGKKQAQHRECRGSIRCWIAVMRWSRQGQACWDLRPWQDTRRDACACSCSAQAQRSHHSGSLPSHLSVRMMHAHSSHLVS